MSNWEKEMEKEEKLLLTMPISPVTSITKDTPIIFLDIDGVLQPCHHRYRFENNLDDLKASYILEDPSYTTLNKYDLGAVKYDWRPESVELLKQLCILGKAKIVLSSNWRTGKTIEQLKLLFKIHGLDTWLVDKTPDLQYLGRNIEIKRYLDSIPDRDPRTPFMIIDDSHIKDLRSTFPGQFILSPHYLDEPVYLSALKILAWQDFTKQISFIPLAQTHLTLLAQWFEKSRRLYSSRHNDLRRPLDDWFNPKNIEEGISGKYHPRIQGIIKLENGTEIPLVAYMIELAGKPIGYVHYHEISTEGFLTLDFFMGDIDFIGLGLGPSLLKYFLAQPELQKFKAIRITLPTYDDAIMVSFFKKAGFTALPSDEILEDPEDEPDEICLHYWLNAEASTEKLNQRG